MNKKISAVLLSLFLMTGLLLSQGIKRPMDFEDIFKIKQLSNPVPSPDGKYVLYTVREANWDKNKWITHIWRVNVETKKAIQMTRGEGEWSPRWSPCGKVIAFITNRNDNGNQIYFMFNSGGEAWKVTNHKPGITGFKYAKEGKIYFTAHDSLTTKEKEKKEKIGNAYFVDENYKNVHIWELNIKKKKKRKITDGNFSIRRWELSPSQSKIAFIAAPTPRRDDDIYNEIYTIELDNLKMKKLTSNGAIERSLKWAPDESFITFVSDSDENLNTYYLESIFHLPLDGGKIKDLLPDFQYQVYSHFWNVENKIIYFTANTGVNVQLFSLNTEANKVKQLTEGVNVIGNVEYNDELGKIVFTNTNPQQPDEVYISDIDNIEFEKLTNSNKIIDELNLAKYETIRWKSKDGKMVEGILIYPPDYDSSKKYPMVVQLHGGPESSYKNYFSTSWTTYPHVLAGKGFLLFQPNYRGSTGYGDDCMRAIIGHYFEKDIDDIITGVEYLINKGIVDNEHMAVHGWSAGGHLTNWIITHFDMFKAASSGAGGANWFSFYAQTDMQYIREIWFDGSPYEKTELFQKKSPVHYAKNCNTPTIIFCGEDDNRVPFPQSLEMYRALKRNGKTVKFVAFPNTYHGLSQLKHQMYKMKKEYSWFMKYLFGKEIEN